MRVIYDLIFFSKEIFGGISRMWMEHFKLLSMHQIEPVFIIGPSKNLTQEFLETNEYFGGKVIKENPVWKFKGLRQLSFYRNWQLLKVNINNNGCIFHSTDYINPLIKKKSLKVVTTIHDMVFWDQKDRFRKNIIYLDKICSIYHSLKISDQIITVSETSKSSILKRFPWAESKINVIYHGLHNSMRNIKLINEKENSFLFIGARNCYKNFDFLLNAFSEFVKDFPDWILHVTGENEHTMDQEYLKYKGLGIKDHVYDHGLVSQEKLIELLRKTSALIIPSLNEGFNLPLLEAMGAGAPVLSSDIPVSKELGREHVKYFSLDSVDSLISEMREIAENPLSYDLLLEAQRYARCFNWEENFNKVVDVYKKCFN